MNFVAGLALLTFCLGWTVWWGVRFAHRRRWGWAVLLWLLAAALLVEVGFNAMAAARRTNLSAVEPG